MNNQKDISGTTAGPGAASPAGQNQTGAGGVGQTVRESAWQAKEQLKQTASSMTEELKHKGTEAIHDLRAKGSDLAAQQKSTFTNKLFSCASASRRAAEQLRETNDTTLAHYADFIADQLERGGSYLRDRDLKAMYRDVESAIRRQPELFFGGMLLAGLALARFIKASRHNEEMEPSGTALYSEQERWETELPEDAPAPTSGAISSTTPASQTPGYTSPGSSIGSSGTPLL